MWEGMESQLIIIARYLAIGALGPVVLTLALVGHVEVRVAVLVVSLFKPIRTMCSQFCAVTHNDTKPELRELLSASVLYVCFTVLFARTSAPAHNFFPLLFACFNPTTSRLIN